MKHNEEEPFPSGEDKPELGAFNSTENKYPKRSIIGERVREARLAVGLKQRELAGQQFSTSYISALERGRVIPSFRALGKLASRLGVTISALLGESGLPLSALVANRTAKEIIAEIKRSEREEGMRIPFGKVEGMLFEAQPLKALQLLGGGDDPPSQLTVFEHMQWCWLASWACGFIGKSLQAIRLAQQGLELAEQLLAQATLAEKPFYKEWAERLRCYLGSAYCANGQPGLAWFYHRQCLSAVGEGSINDPYLMLVIHRALGKDALALGWYKDAITFYRIAYTQAERLKILREQGLIAWGLAAAYRDSGDLYRARSNYQQALQAFAALENLQMVLQVRMLLGNILVELQEYTEAEQHLRLSLESAASLQDLSTWAITLNNLSALSLAKQEVEQSISLAQAGLALARQSRNQWAESDLHLSLAEAYQAAHDREAAEQAFQIAIQIAKQSQSYDVLCDACERYSKFLRSQGRFREEYQQMELTLPLGGRGA